MSAKTYMPRLIGTKVSQHLSAFGAICIEGPKWAGKTMTSEHHCKSSFFIGAPAGNFSNRKLALMDPSLILDGDTPRLIDEWQEVPAIWDAVRYTVDQRREKRQFILTGSSTPVRKGIFHSGAGRISKLRMRPMSLYEAGVSIGKISLHDLFYKQIESELTGEISLHLLIEQIIRGGWPGTIGLDFNLAKLVPQQYIEAFITDDVNRVDGITRDLKKIRLLLRSLARNESTSVTNKTLQPKFPLKLQYTIIPMSIPQTSSF